MTQIDHTCKQTCAGWQHGYEAGRKSVLAQTADQLTLNERHLIAIGKLLAFEQEWKNQSLFKRLISGHEYKSKTRHIVDELKATDPRRRP